jgi:hypothetical protein
MLNQDSQKKLLWIIDELFENKKLEFKIIQLRGWLSKLKNQE